MVTLVTPLVPILPIAPTTTASAAPNGLPCSSTLTPGAARISGTLDSSIVLPSSASLPIRRTIAVSGRPPAPSVLRMPAASISADARTKTTSAMPTAVAMVVALRTTKLRML